MIFHSMISQKHLSNALIQKYIGMWYLLLCFLFVRYPFTPFFHTELVMRKMRHDTKHIFINWLVRNLLICTIHPTQILVRNNHKNEGQNIWYKTYEDADMANNSSMSP